MDVGMRHGLASSSPIVDADIKRIQANLIFQFAPHHCDEGPQGNLFTVAEIKNALDMFPRDDERVVFTNWKTVCERNKRFILPTHSVRGKRTKWAVGWNHVYFTIALKTCESSVSHQFEIVYKAVGSGVP